MFTSLSRTLSIMELVEEGILLRVRRVYLVETLGAVVVGTLYLGRGNKENKNIFSNSRADSII